MTSPTTARRPAQTPAVFDANLFERLQQRFALTPNYARPLSDHIVDHHVDGTPITEHDYVAKRLLAERGVAVYGGRIEQTWSWRVDGIAFQFNAAWEHCRHFGVQYASRCQGCGMTLWHRADRRPAPWCPGCRSEDVTRRTGRCPETGLARSTAYVKERCRCPACRAWNTEFHRQRRRRRAISTAGTRLPGNTAVTVTTRLSPSHTDRDIGAFPEMGFRRGLRQVVTEDTDAPDTWVWLPAAVRAVLAEYCRDWEAYVDAMARTLETGSGRARRTSTNALSYWDKHRDDLDIES